MQSRCLAVWRCPFGICPVVVESSVERPLLKGVALARKEIAASLWSGGGENATDSLFLFGRICGGEGRDGMGVAMAMATQPLRLRRLRVGSVAILPRLLPFIALWLLSGDC